MYWSDEEGDPDMCAGPPGMDSFQMKFPSAAEQMKDDMSVRRWFNEVIRVRNTYPVIARGVTQKADLICDDKVAAFIRSNGTDDDLLIVMNLRGQTAEKDLKAAGKGFKPVEKLCADNGKITYKNGILTMPAYSIAVFTGKK
jgi:hypothetical protein